MRRDAGHYVYVAWRGDEALYVGMTYDYEQRLLDWERSGGWWRDATHVDVWEVGPGRTNAEHIERDAIRALDPAHNRMHSPRVERDKQAWQDYCRWSDALLSCDTFPDRSWAADQALADRVCAAVGVQSPDVAAVVESNRERMRRIVESVGSLKADRRPEAERAAS